MKFAKQSNFDPLVAENWYNASSENFRNMKVKKRIVILLFILYANIFSSTQSPCCNITKEVYQEQYCIFCHLSI